MQSAVIIFPGSNCDRDVITSLTALSGKKPHIIWHNNTDLPKVDLIIIPGGFSFGDYLRCGAIAARSPVMREIIKAYEQGVYILGICNGFQILTETGILPGTLLCNKKLKFICDEIYVKYTNSNSKFTASIEAGEVLKLPVAHHDGNYYATEDIIKNLQDNDLIAFHYCDSAGNINEEANFNGSVNNIAAIFDKHKRVLGMMPHPERACNKITKNEDGAKIFNSLIRSFS